MTKAKCPRKRLKKLRGDESKSKFALRIGCTGDAITRYESDDPKVQRSPCAAVAWRLYELSSELGDPIKPPDWLTAV